MDGPTKKITIVTFEFEGITRNGGIGTAYRLLADLLTREGHEVTVLLVSLAGSLAVAERAAKARLLREGIRLELLSEPKTPSPTPWFLHRSILVCELLRQKEPDVVHFADNQALGYHLSLAKSLGLAFRRTRLIVGTHGSLAWCRRAANEPDSDPQMLTLDSMERRSVEHADAVVSPSRYMIDHLSSLGWKLPKRRYVIPNVNRLSKPFLRTTSARALPVRGSRTHGGLVFFGRLETRKGLTVFIDALEKLLGLEPNLGSERRLPVTFLGKDGYSFGRGWASEYAAERLRPYADRLRIEFRSDLSSDQARALLAKLGDRLVCMPSPLDNSPYTIVEAIELQMSFLATRNGGQAELLSRADRARFLCESGMEALAEKLRQLLKEPRRPPCRPSNMLVEANARWVRFHRERSVPNPSPPEATRSARLSISVCLSPKMSDEARARARRDLSRQTLRPLEVLAMRDGDRARDWRKALARQARGRLVLFLDGAFTISERALELLAFSYRRAGAPIIAAQMRDSLGSRIVPPDELFDAICRPPLAAENTLVDRMRFLKLTRDRGAPETPGELIAMAALSGWEPVTIPEVLFECAPLRASAPVEAPAPGIAGWRLGRKLPKAYAPLLSVIAGMYETLRRGQLEMQRVDKELAFARLGDGRPERRPCPDPA